MVTSTKILKSGFDKCKVIESFYAYMIYKESYSFTHLYKINVRQ
ncbi:hypothetical protein ABAYE0087 [Acinetobacter baumannii AYE]|nr:hypothetical protein ABAYE0087 [Acinetobacter baumannii AYE]